tara:strand:+ start:6083 stop:6682 length:600 start_codon:yes stop_codon:yes gene_type:complete
LVDVSNETIRQTISKSIEVKTKLSANDELISIISEVIDLVVRVFKNDGKIFICGNGGSAADAQHIAAEFTGRFYIDREPLFAEALHVNTSYLTAVANDYGYDQVFSRLVKAKCSEGDALIGISTSGNSTNIVRALSMAKELNVHTIGLVGDSGNAMAKHCDFILEVPSKDTPRIQEAHIMIGHIICENVEKIIFYDEDV